MDDLSVIEPAAASESGSAVTEPNPALPAANQSATAVTQSTPAIAESCSQCSALLAHDQRYCLQCGAPRAHVSGPISGGWREGFQPHASAPQAGRPQDSAPQAGRPQEAAVSQQTLLPAAPGGPPPGLGGPPVAPGTPLVLTHPPARNNTLALLAGIGVLLLAMGVGVLIGRAGAGSSKPPPAQVISLGSSPAGATPTTPTATTPAATPQTPATSTKKQKESKAKEPATPNSSITKPAPPSVVQSLHTRQSGQSYEQKSKSLPNVVETG